MNFLKALFGGKEKDTEEEKKQEQEKDFDVLKFDGVRALRSGEVAYAVRCFTHALDIKDDLETRDYLSQAYIRNDELLPAYEQLQKLAEAQPENEEIFLRMAQVAYMMEDYGALTDACEHALLINKDDPKALLLYARGCIGQGDEANAIAMLTKCISLTDAVSSDDSEAQSFVDEARLLRGQTLLKMENLQEAAEDAGLLLQRKPAVEDVLLLEARIATAQEDREKALIYYNKVVEANPFCVEAFRERSEVRRSLGDVAGAEEDLRAVLELDPHATQDSEDADGNALGTDIQRKVEQAYRNNNPFGLG
ncbi:MAG: hypothetical protein MSD82_03470 [Prevotella sp.]|nr:hypothetical protein [Prevotella sp.]